MVKAQWNDLLNHPGFNLMCTACGTIALLDPALGLAEAQVFQSEHARLTGHETGSQTQLRPHVIMTQIENYPKTVEVLRPLKLVSPQEFNRPQQRK